MSGGGAAHRLVIVGGGFTGTVLAIHIIGVTSYALDITILEPSQDLGRGIAYGTEDPNHRMNVPSDRMGLSAKDSLQATRWFLTKGVLPDEASNDGQGHAYVPRHDYGSFMGDRLRAVVDEAQPRVMLRHCRASATAVSVEADGVWRIACDDGTSVDADTVALCFGHATPAVPCPIADTVSAHPKFVPNPWAKNALSAIAPEDRVTIVGTGLTMADVVMSLEAQGHRGPVTAVSRRGLLPLGHGAFITDLEVLCGAPPPRRALDLLRLVRRRVKETAATVGWQPVVDSLRAILPDVWNALPPMEQRKVVRRLLPFWEIHRFRIAPQIDAALRRARANGALTIEKAGVSSIVLEGRDFALSLRRPDGTRAAHTSDALVLCTGPDRDLRNNPLIAAILAGGFGRIDDAGIGLAVDRHSRVLDGAGRVQPGLMAFGPMTRGSFGEMTGAPDIAHHIERVVPHLFQNPSREEKS